MCPYREEIVYSLDDEVYLASWDSGVLLKLLIISKDFMLFSVELEGGPSVFLSFIKAWHLHLTLREDDPKLISATISKFSKGVLRIGQKKKVRSDL